MHPARDHSRRALMLVALVCMTSGCTPLREYVSNGLKVGPNYRRPAAPVANDWIDANDGGAGRGPGDFPKLAAP
jgi:hypothetical protein